MKIRIVSYSDLLGGASLGAYRLHQSFIQQSVDSKMLVVRKVSDDPRVVGPATIIGKAFGMLAPHLSRPLLRLQKDFYSVTRSLNLIPTSLYSQIMSSGADVINLQWVNREAISIRQIGRLKKPVVFTLRDMWAFCGTEHYCPDLESSRFRQGYHKDNFSVGQRSWLDLDRWTWGRKRHHWRSPRHVVCISHWLADCVRNSLLMKGWPVHVIPNTLNLNRFCPLDKCFCRQALGLPPDVPLIAFGAIGGVRDQRKGFDLLEVALGILANGGDLHGLECVVFGQSEPPNPPRLGLPLRFFGYLHDEYSLALLYNAVDVMVVPSRQEAFGKTAAEALACGCPVVAFNSTGLKDVVVHGVTGYLAEPYEPSDLAKGIRWVLEDPSRRQVMAVKARERALRLWSPEVVVAQYLQVYEAALSIEKG